MQKNQKSKLKKKKKIDDLFSKFKEIDNAATEQKKQNDVIDLIDDVFVLGENNSFNKTIKTGPEDIFIDDDLFDDTDQKDSVSILGD